jgi:hypothetical protein
MLTWLNGWEKDSCREMSPKTIYGVQHLGHVVPTRSTLKSQLIMAYILIRDPLAKIHSQLRQDTVRLLALAGRRRPGRLCARTGGKNGPPRPPGHLGVPQRPADPTRVPAGPHVPTNELHQPVSPRTRDLWGKQEESLTVPKAGDPLLEGPRDDAGEHLPQAWDGNIGNARNAEN